MQNGVVYRDEPQPDTVKEPLSVESNQQSNRYSNFRDELENLINRHSMENGSDTPDFILADYLLECLKNYEQIVSRRERWYGRG